MNFTSPRKKFILLVLLGTVLFAVLLFLASLSFRQEPASPKTISEKDPYADYTSINKLVPGKSTEEDVIKTVGKPKRTSVTGNKKYLKYDAPFEGFENYVVIENSRVSYALENVFANYRGTLEDYIERYGKEDALFYETQDEGTWYVFLDEGVALNIYGPLRQIFYFIPQDENSFFDNFKDELQITKEPHEEHIETFIPEDITPVFE